VYADVALDFGDLRRCTAEGRRKRAQQLHDKPTEQIASLTMHQA